MKHGKPKSDPKHTVPPENPTQAPPKPLRPHRKLFVVLFLTFLVWIAVLLTMYFKTVYPQRYGRGHQPSTGAGVDARPGASGLPSAPR